MIAFHGKQKPPILQNLLAEVLDVVMAELPTSIASSFEKYDFAQMHGTMVGMEVIVRDDQCFGRWFKDNWKEDRPINIDRLHAVMQQLVRERGDRLFTIRFAGFPKFHCKCRETRSEAINGWLCASGTDTSPVFHSCDRTGYDGSFYATPGPVMITGWPVNSPVEPGAFPHTLYDFRRSVEAAGFSDKYHYECDHKDAHWKDDDCFIKIGKFASPTTPEQRDAIDAALRAYLSNRKPVTVDITADDVSIVLYDDPSLHLNHVKKRVNLKQFLDDPQEVERMYKAVKEQRVRDTTVSS